jgi:hypothetical protein
MGLPRLNIRLDVPLAEGLFDPKFDGVFSDGGIALGDHDDLAMDLGPFVGKRLNDFVVNVVPVFPRQLVNLKPNLVEPSLASFDDDLSAFACPFSVTRRSSTCATACYCRCTRSNSVTRAAATRFVRRERKPLNRNAKSVQ